MKKDLQKVLETNQEDALSLYQKLVTQRLALAAVGGEGGLAIETETTPSPTNVKKRGAYPPLAARCVSWLFDLKTLLVSKCSL